MFAQPFVAVIVVPIMVIFVWLRQYFVKTSREIKRIEALSKYKTRVIPNNVCIVISTQFNLNCIFRIDLIHLQQKSLQEYVNTITCTRILNLNSVRKLRVSNKQLRIKAVISKAFFCSF